MRDSNRGVRVVPVAVLDAEHTMRAREATCLAELLEDLAQQGRRRPCTRILVACACRADRVACSRASQQLASTRRHLRAGFK